MPTILFVMKYPLHRKENLKAKFDGQLAAAGGDPDSGDGGLAPAGGVCLFLGHDRVLRSQISRSSGCWAWWGWSVPV